MKRLLILSALIAILWGCCNVEDTPKADEKNKTADYKVEHYQQNIDNDEYTPVNDDTQFQTGETDTDTAATAKDYAGFTAKEVTQVKIAADGSTVVKIYYDRKQITLTFDTDGGSKVESITGKYGATVTVTAPTKTGYEFAGWNPSLPATFPAENATYTAKWTKEGDYKITYNLNGGTNNTSNPASYNVETETITLAGATKTGYIFAGWYKDEACTDANKVTEITKGSTGAVTLYAKWTAGTADYKVEHYQQNIDNDEYTLVNDDTEIKNGTADEVTSATAKTYAGFTAQTVEQVKIAADGSTVVKIYYDRKQITLTFDTDGGSEVESINGKYGATVTAPANPAKTGYTFAGWNPALPAAFPAENATYTAKWTKEGDYKITYNLNGGTNNTSNPASYNVETETITLAGATKTGYIFAGWYKDEACTDANKVTEITKGSTGAVTLYAKWTAGTADYKVEHYQQNIDNDEYTLVNDDTENKTGVTDETTTAEAKDYAGFTAKEVTQVKIAADGSTVVKIYYDRNIITLTFDTDGGSKVESITGKYGATVTAPANPAKTGYTFAGWNPSLPATFPAENATYTAKWTAGTGTAYKVEHYQQNIADDGYTLVNADTENKTGVTDKTTTAEAKDYAGFTAKTVEQMKIAADGSTVVKIYYDRNTITLTFDTDGGSKVESITGKYGATVTVTAPTKTGYKFIAWEPELPDTFPAENAEYKAKWKWDSTGFVLVQGTTISGAITADGDTTSEIFKDGETVTIGNFYICDHEVTQAEYKTYCNYTNADKTPSDTYGVGDNYPAYYLYWYDTIVYCNKRSIAEGLTPCYTIDGSTNPDDWGDVPTENNSTWNAATCDFTANGYRLPTEAEWEYAARGGNKLILHQYTYAGSDTIDDVAWYSGNSESKTHEVKGKKANVLDLYDMSGNVWEWCWDDESSHNWLRGGAYNSEAYHSTVRTQSYPPSVNYLPDAGFRVVRTVE